MRNHWTLRLDHASTNKLSKAHFLAPGSASTFSTPAVWDLTCEVDFLHHRPSRAGCKRENLDELDWIHVEHCRESSAFVSCADATYGSIPRTNIEFRPQVVERPNFRFASALPSIVSRRFSGVLPIHLFHRRNLFLVPPLFCFFLQLSTKSQRPVLTHRL